MAFVACFLVITGLFAQPTIVGVDGQSNYAYLLSLVRNGDLDLTDDYELIDASQEKHYQLSDARRSRVTGLPENRYSPGAAIFWAPAVGLVHLALRWNSPQAATGLSPPYRWAVALSSAFWGGLGLLLLLRRVERDWGDWVALHVVLLMTFATALGFYLWLHGSMSHAVSFFVSTAALLALDRAWDQGTRVAAFVAGVFAGLLPTVRIQDATWTMVLGAGLLLFWPSRDPEESPASTSPRASRWAGVTMFALGSLLSTFPLLAVWRVFYGNWLSGPQGYLGLTEGGQEIVPRHLIQVLFSERGGVFAWHPVLLIGFLGLAVLAWKGNRLAIVSLIGVSTQIYLVSGWFMWWGGWSFGNRLFISAYPALTLGLAWFVARSLRSVRPRWLLIATGFLLLWNLGLLIQYGANLIPKDQEVGWSEVVHNQFTEVPHWLYERLRSVGSSPRNAGP